MTQKNPSDEAPRLDVNPEERLLTRRQAERLARLSDVPAEKLVEQPVAEVLEQLKYHIDPGLLLFRRICGRVVKENPSTGQLEGVPNATVYAEDTDGCFLGYFPNGFPYYWLWPFKLRRETLWTTRTDRCGNFCVWIPAWDVDHYLRWRLRWRCYPEIVRPRIVDLIPELPELLELPRPLPDPPPERLERLQRLHRPELGDRDREALLERAMELLPRADAERLQAVVQTARFGDPVGDLSEVLQLPAFRKRLPPPVPDKLRRVLGRGGDEERERERGLTELPVSAEVVRKIDVDRYLGPFLVCEPELVAEWATLLDVPDLTFRVTQDTDGDGNEETIYSEGLFEVRWNATSIPNLTLVADGHALSSPQCDPVPVVCEDKPDISTVGYMTLAGSHHDGTTGYALRPNGPSSNGVFGPAPGGPAPAGDGEAPYIAALNLHGCHRIDGASHYRVLYSYEGSADQPFLGLEWYNPRSGAVGPPVHVVPDSQGWYEILNQNLVDHPNWLLWWPTWRYANGVYDLRLELGTAGGGGINPQGTSDPRRFVIDNTRPELAFEQVRWRPVGGSWNGLNVNLCPVIPRPTGQALELEVTWNVSATHLRSAQVSAYGCGGGGFDPLPAADRLWWWTDPSVNSVTRTTVFTLPAGRPAGCYHVHLSGVGRAFNPSGFDAGPSLDWYILQSGFTYRAASRAISIVDAAP